MKSFIEYLNEASAGTFISIRFDDESNKKLNEFAKSLNLTPIKDFHSTIVYSPKKLDVPLGDGALMGAAKITGIKYLGDVDSEWRAVVLELKSDIIQKRHEYYVKEFNYVHSYDQFIQHVSLAYSPPEDLDLTKVKLPSFSININKETVELLRKK